MPASRHRQKSRPRSDSGTANPTGWWCLRGGCLEVLEGVSRKHPEGLFDMIFADPPYFLSNGGVTCQNGRMVSVDKGGWDRSQGAQTDHAFHLGWLKACQAALKPNGTIWVSGTHHVIHSVGYAMQSIGMKILNNITWEKPNPPPNLACRYFTHSTETLLWAAKSPKSKHTFNYDRMKESNGGKQMKSVWRFLPPQPWEKKHGKHPTQKPVALLERIIEASTLPRDFICDPFMGSGTTGVAALRSGRRFLGIELSAEYVALARHRLSDHSPLTATRRGGPIDTNEPTLGLKFG